MRCICVCELALAQRAAKFFRAANSCPNLDVSSCEVNTYPLARDRKLDSFRKRFRGRIAMDIKAQAEKAEKLRKLHQGPRILALPNAWDAVSARILEEVGHPAVATSSAAVAFSHGYPDGQRISRGEMLHAVARIARAVGVPVSADLESGYGKTLAEIAEFNRRDGRCLRSGGAEF